MERKNNILIFFLMTLSLIGIVSAVLVATPSLVNVDFSSDVINLELNVTKKVFFTIVNQTTVNLPIKLTIDSDSINYLHSVDSLVFSLPSNGSKTIEFRVYSTEKEYNDLVEIGSIDAKIEIDVVNGQEISIKTLKIIPKQINFLVNLLFQESVEGIPNMGIFIFIVIILFLGGVFSDKKK